MPQKYPTGACLVGGFLLLSVVLLGLLLSAATRAIDRVRYRACRDRLRQR